MTWKIYDTSRRKFNTLIFRILHFFFFIKHGNFSLLDYKNQQLILVFNRRFFTANKYLPSQFRFLENM